LAEKSSLLQTQKISLDNHPPPLTMRQQLDAQNRSDNVSSASSRPYQWNNWWVRRRTI